MEFDRDVGFIVTMAALFGYASAELDGYDVIGPNDYCQNKVFNGTCPVGHVIVITQALHGRMKIGPCVNSDYGYIGCSDDVLSLADNRCSGRNNCSIPVPNSDFDLFEDCPTDFKTYFSVAYKCVPVLSSLTVGHRCVYNGPIEVTSSKGFLSSFIAQTTGMGAPECQWLIRAQPGQKINFTLYDFSARVSRGVYAVITDGTASYQVMWQDTRVKAVYLSSSNEVEVRLLTSLASRNFLIEYKVIGCADLVLPAHADWRRDDNHATVTCTLTGKKSQLTCRGGSWGEFDNCTDASAREVLGKNGPLPFTGASLVVIIVIAAALGAVILVTGLVFIKCRRQIRYLNSSCPNVYQPAAPKEVSNSPFTYPSQHRGEAECMYQSSENEYAYISDFPPLSSAQDDNKKCADYGTACPSPQVAGGKTAEQSGGDAKQGRRYMKGAKIPQYVGIAHQNATLPRDPPAYFVLDPDNHKPERLLSKTRARASSTNAATADVAAIRGQSLRQTQMRDSKDVRTIIADTCDHNVPAQPGAGRSSIPSERAPETDLNAHVVTAQSTGTGSSAASQFTGDTMPNGTVMRRMNQSIHEFTSCACDHLVDSPENTNHKSV